LKYLERTPIQQLADSFKGKITVIAGIPGTGKSTLGEQLAAAVGGVYKPEYVQPDLLDLYLGNQEKYAFAFQVIMAKERISIYREAVKEAQQGKAVFVDGPLVCDNAFAKMLWNNGKGPIFDEEYAVYQKIMESDVGQYLPPPDYIVYLDCKIVVALQRIKKRGRPGEYEAYSKDDYLYKLKCGFYDVFHDVPVNYIDYNEDYLDMDGKIPQLRIHELLGLIRDQTFLQAGIPCPTADDR
jgi:deoxyadenosine/deoxycytidine kinase